MKLTPDAYTVYSRLEEIGQVVTVVVSPSEGGRAPEFDPGQFCMLYLPPIGEIPISISGPAEAGGELHFTVRAVGAVSRAITELDPGDQLGLRGPYGRGWPIERAKDRDLVVIAGGLGLAPLRPVVYAAQGGRQSFGRVVLLYGCRSPEERLFEEEYRRWKNEGEIEMHRTVDVAPAGYRGRVGLVTRLIPRALQSLSDPVVMVCGPEVMMRYCAQELLGAGVQAEDIYLSLERNMKCAVGVCGRCQYGPSFVCKDGPVLSFAELESRLIIREL